MRSTRQVSSLSETKEILNSLAAFMWKTKNEELMKKTQIKLKNFLKTLSTQQIEDITVVPSVQLKNIQKIIIESLVLTGKLPLTRDFKFINDVIECEATSTNEPNFFTLRSEKKLLESSHFAMKCESSPGGHLIVGLNVRDMDAILMELSANMCFCEEPPVNDVHTPWFSRLLRFSLAQFIANLLEMRIWRSYRYYANTSQYEPCLSIYSDPLYYPLQLVCSHSNAESLILEEIYGALKDCLKSTDDEKFSFLTRTTLKRYGVNAPSSASIREKIQTKMWFMACIASDTSSNQVTKPDSVIGMKCKIRRRMLSFLCVPLVHWMTPIHEYRALVLNRVLTVGRGLLCNELLKETLSTDVKINNDVMNAKKRTKNKKSKNKSSNKKKTVTTEKSSSHMETKSNGDVSTEDSTAIFNMSFRPDEVGLELYRKTEFNIFFGQIIESIIDGCFNIVDSTVVTSVQSFKDTDEAIHKTSSKPDKVVKKSNLIQLTKQSNNENKEESNLNFNQVAPVNLLPNPVDQSTSSITQQSTRTKLSYLDAARNQDMVSTKNDPPVYSQVLKLIQTESNNSTLGNYTSDSNNLNDGDYYHNFMGNDLWGNGPPDSITGMLLYHGQYLSDPDSGQYHNYLSTYPLLESSTGEQIVRPTWYYDPQLHLQLHMLSHQQRLNPDPRSYGGSNLYDGLYLQTQSYPQSEGPSSLSVFSVTRRLLDEDDSVSDTDLLWPTNQNRDDIDASEEINDHGSPLLDSKESLSHDGLSSKDLLFQDTFLDTSGLTSGTGSLASPESISRNGRSRDSPTLTVHKSPLQKLTIASSPTIDTFDSPSPIEPDKIISPSSADHKISSGIAFMESDMSNQRQLYNVLAIQCLLSEASRAKLLNQDAMYRAALRGFNTMPPSADMYHPYPYAADTNFKMVLSYPLKILRSPTVRSHTPPSPLTFREAGSRLSHRSVTYQMNRPIVLTRGIRSHSNVAESKYVTPFRDIRSDVLSEDGDRDYSSTRMRDEQLSMKALLPLQPLSSPHTSTNSNTLLRDSALPPHPEIRSKTFTELRRTKSIDVSSANTNGLQNYNGFVEDTMDDKTRLTGNTVIIEKVSNDMIDITGPPPSIASAEVSSGGYKFKSQLTLEIQDFVYRVELASRRSRRAKLEVLERMRVTVQSLWPRAQVKAFGSFVSGLGLPRCDLDMVICLPKVHREAGPEAPGILEGRNAVKESWQQNLSRCLCREDWVDANSIKVIGNTAIPVLKVRTRAQPARDLAEDDSVSLDVSFEGPGHRGLEANKLTTTLMKAHAALRPLLLVLKSFLARKALSESYTGGLSSYSLLLLLTRFLQETSGGGPSQEAGVEDLGALLIGFLRFYGERFDPRQTGVSVRSRCYFSRRETTSHPFVQSVAVPLTTDLDSDNNAVPDLDRRHSFQGGRPETPSSASGLFPFKFDPLYVEDPLEPRNNVARNCFRVSQVQKLWTEAACAIVSNLRSRLDDVTDHIKEGHLLEPLIGSE